MSAVGVRPAEALLASSLVREEELDELIEEICGLGKRKGMGRGGEEGMGRLGTGVKSVDDALDGGLVGGRVVGIWGESGGAGMEVCRALLVDSLLKYPDSTAAVVDTTGNFDVLKLYSLILSRLQKDADVLDSVRVAAGCGLECKVEDVAANILDHVKMMQVFDFVGVKEAIGEIRDDLEGRKAPKSKKEDGRPETKTNATPPPPEPEEEPQPVQKRTVVQDSEDEADDEEMLFDTSTPPRPAPESNLAVPDPHTPQQPDLQGPQSPNNPSLILIDNLTQVLTPLLKKDYIHANALTSPFLHTLSHLTRTHNLHTILLNPATPPRPTSPSRPTAPQEHRKPDPPPPPSIFASNSLVPSLVAVMGRYVDTGILVGNLPRRKMDARIYYRELEARGAGAGSGVTKLRGVEMVGVVEVLWDRWEGRVGAWGVFGEGDMGMRDV